MKYFNTLLDSIYESSPLQKKKLEKYLAKKEESFFKEAENFAEKYSNYLNSQNIPLSYAISSYNNMCKNMMKSQISFMKTGTYTIHSSDEAYKNVYNDEKEMKSYMIGLAISQYLWETHYAIFSLFGKYINAFSPNISSYLEIGPGHGLFLSKALDALDKTTDVTALDISPISINITKSIIKFFNPDKKVQFINEDMLKFHSRKKYDFIVMCEVLEHVNFPDKLLIKMKELLNPDGRAFISTCVNCPAIDHVYHFKFVEEVRKILTDSGFEIEDELILPVEDLAIEEIISRKITINYCALLKGTNV